MINQVYKFESEMKLAVACTDPATPASGDPTIYGQLGGVAEGDEDANGLTVVNFGPGVFLLSVKGVDENGNSAVVAGQALYYTIGDTPKISKKTTGSYYGIALGAVNSGATASINVLVMAASSNATITPADASVTAAKLSTSLKTGYHNLDITIARIIATNDIQATTEAGVPDANTAGPKLLRVNAATDKALRLAWAATEVNEIQFAPWAYPPDLDDGADVTVHFLAAMSDVNNTPVLTLAAFEGLGDSTMGGNTAAVTGTAIAEYSVTLALANVGAHPNFLNLSVLPGAHANDVVYLYAAWIEYTRK